MKIKIKFKPLIQKIDRLTEHIIAFFDILKFKTYKIKRKSVLIVEPNPYHGEILPGFVKYFQEVLEGYNTDLFLRRKNITDSPFINIKNINIFTCSPLSLKYLLKQDKISRYDFVFFSTSVLWEEGYYKNTLLKYLGYIPKTKYGILMTEHNPKSCLEEFGEIKYIKEQRLFTLSGFCDTKMLNPHYFINLKPAEKNQKTIFVTAGRFVKSPDLMYRAIDKLFEENIDNFEILITGAAFKPNKKYRKIIKSLGFINFKNMYKIIEKSDFILPLFDPENKDHKVFLGNATSGSRQLSLGFLKPMCINEKFAPQFGLTNSNSVIYEGENLHLAIKSAINMKNEDYKTMQLNLKTLADSIYKSSLDNLKDSIKNIFDGKNSDEQ